MQWVFVVVGGLLVFGIAAVLVGSEAFRLGHETRSAVFDVDEAVQAVGDALPPEAQARLTYDEVRQLVLTTLRHLEGKGLAALPGDDVHTPDEVVLDEGDAVAVVLGAVDREELDVSDEDAYEVVRALLDHLDEIGAVGPPA
jgi:hypothetical protein